jgi:ribosomal-protein-alanine N-acetyltransferase
VLATPTAADRDDYLRAVRKSRAFHRPWVYPPATARDFAKYLRASRGSGREVFFARTVKAGELVSVVDLSVITLGVLKSAYLGFFAMVPHERQGYTQDAVSLALTRIFSELKLHRVAASVQPENKPSLALLERLGFRYEGYSPRYLKIGGRWRDHELWAILAEEWRTGRPVQSRAVRR